MPYKDPEKQREAVRRSLHKRRGYQRGDRSQIYAKISPFLDKLDWRERTVIESYYRDSLSLKAIGLQLGCSRQNAARIKSQALKKIEALTNEKPIGIIEEQPPQFPKETQP